MTSKHPQQPWPAKALSPRSCHTPPHPAALSLTLSLPPARSPPPLLSCAFPPSRSYETMLVLRPSMADEERDQELAKFQAFLQKQGASQLSDMVRGRQRLAYHIKR